MRVSVSAMVSGGLNVGWRLPCPVVSFVPGSWAALTRASTLPMFGLPKRCPFFGLAPSLGFGGLVRAKLCSTSEYLHSLPGKGRQKEQREDKDRKILKAGKNRERAGGRGRERGDMHTQHNRDWMEERNGEGWRDTERQTEKYWQQRQKAREKGGR